MPLPRMESLSGTPIELRRVSKTASSRDLPDLRRLGATGFIGAHVARKLIHRGDTVTALIRPTSETRLIDDQRGRSTTVRD